MNDVIFENAYGLPPSDLVTLSAAPQQFSPLVPGALSLEAQPHGSLNGLAMLAPPGTIERRFVLAHALVALQPGAQLVALAPKDKGGSRLRQDFELLGCQFSETARRHHRIVEAVAPADPAALEAAIQDGSPTFLDDIGLWSQPGVFSWNRIDPGSAVLLDHLPPLSGQVADFGCGIGVLSKAVLTSAKVTQLTMVDLDRRAIEMAKRNITDDRAQFVWADVRALPTLLTYDCVVMNPPFHEGGLENQALGQSFIMTAARALKNGGICWLTANRHLPYEAILKPLFRRVTLMAEADGYKIYQAQK